MGILSRGFFSLGEDVNKVQSSTDGEGEIGDLLPELTLELDDEELVKLKNDWIKKWEPYGRVIALKQKENEEYWLGNQFSEAEGKRPLIDNLIFEALETFLPIATRPKAEPQVSADNTEEGNALADKVRMMLTHLSDILFYNLKMKQVTRYWALYLLGCMKVGWSEEENDVTCQAIRPQKLVLDPEATIDGCIYTGNHIGELMDDVASDLVIRFPKSEKFIRDKVKGLMGTKVDYFMWSTKEFMFWSLDKKILGKIKNPHWNYDTEQPGVQTIDEFGAPVDGEPTTIQGKNHFKSPQMPYVFLSIFNLGTQPHDNTNLVQQNLPLQDLINKRLIQIDKNADSANGGLVVSGDAFTEEQAVKAGRALRKGGVVYVPNGNVNDVVKRDGGTPLPPFVYESLQDYRNELRNIFGTRGSSPQGTIREETVGGKQIIRAQDSDRIGGGISTYLEQFSDRVYNWFVQLMYVYYDEQHTASVVGVEKAQEFISLQQNDFISDLTVGVKEGSMVPHDPASEREEAVGLWGQQGIDPITFFERLEFPDPRQSAKQLFLWLNDPVQLFPDLAQQQTQVQQEQQGEEQRQLEVERLEEEKTRLQDQGVELEKIELQALSKEPTSVK